MLQNHSKPRFPFQTHCPPPKFPGRAPRARYPSKFFQGSCRVLLAARPGAARCPPWILIAARRRSGRLPCAGLAHAADGACGRSGRLPLLPPSAVGRPIRWARRAQGAGCKLLLPAPRQGSPGAPPAGDEGEAGDAHVPPLDGRKGVGLNQARGGGVEVKK